MQKFLKEASADVHTSYTFEEYENYIEQSITEQVIVTAKKAKFSLTVFFFATLVTIVLDSVDMIIQLVRFAQPGNDYTEMVLVFAICMLALTNFVWVWWIVHTHLRLPTMFRKNTTSALFGFSGKMVKKLESDLANLKLRTGSWRRNR